MNRALTIVLVFAATFSAQAQDSRPASKPKRKQAVTRAVLEELQSGKAPLTDGFSVCYDDLHGLHGGLTLTIKGDGAVAQKAVRVKAGQTRKVTAEQLKALLKLLIELEAWKQKTPERPPVPDESRARLTITVGERQSEVWEWYNDLAKGQRIIKVRELMKRLAWKPKGE